MVEFGKLRKGPKLMKCAGLGGNPSSLAQKKAKANPKKPKTDVFAAQS